MSNMYEDMTDENVNPLRGECIHDCAYCYVKAQKKRLPGMRQKYTGKPALDFGVLDSKVSGGTRFLCSCNDLFASNVKDKQVSDIIFWASKQKVNWWLQTKNPKHFMFQVLAQDRPDNITLGITMETNRDTSAWSDAPLPKDRLVSGVDYITIEPIMAFDLDEFVGMIQKVNPTFVNIGADSSKPLTGFPEPSQQEIVALLGRLQDLGFEVKLKKNLHRLAPILVRK